MSKDAIEDMKAAMRGEGIVPDDAGYHECPSAVNSCAVALKNAKTRFGRFAAAALARIWRPLCESSKRL
jgi:hypothetical protein